MHGIVGDVARAIAAKDPHRFVVIKEALGLEKWQIKEGVVQKLQSCIFEMQRSP